MEAEKVINLSCQQPITSNREIIELLAGYFFYKVN